MDICKTEQEYLDQVIPAAQRVCKRYGYLVSVLVAQSCLENGYGIPGYWDNPQIEALLKYNNMVGIKSELLSSSWDDKTVWGGESLTKSTPEEYNGRMVTITDKFRKYESIEQSFADFLLFLKYASNYGKGGKPKYGDDVLSIKDPATLIKTVAGRGYATGSTYPTSVMRIVNKHNLTRYDDLSNVKPTAYTPGNKNENSQQSIIKLGNRIIHDITSENRSEVPKSRNGNKIEFIVCHYLGVPNADNPYLYGGGYGGHYNIQRNGEIYLAANPRTAVVWHCGGGLQGSGGHQFHGICTNNNSIGIECGVCYTDKSAKDGDGDSNKWYFTEKTQESLVWLVSKLMDEYGIPASHVIRHYDVTGKICLPLDSTELLTRHGWVALEDVKQGDIVACYDAETDKIVFDAVETIVEPYKSEVLKCRKLEATANHRMWLKPNSENSPKFKEYAWGDALSGSRQFLVKNGAMYESDGLDLSDDEIKLLVWIQGDGHYMTYPGCKDGYYGLEFHLSKERKITRIKALLSDLDIEYKENMCKNGTTHIRVYSRELIHWAETWLDGKVFSYKLLDMDSHQMLVFYDELMKVDGCESAGVYTSTVEQNLDVVQAISALKGMRCSRVHMGTTGNNNIVFSNSNYSIGGVKKNVEKRKTVVSCATVPTGYMLIRQNGNTFIVGNCPNPYVKNNGLNGNWTWEEFLSNVKQYRKDGTITIPHRSGIPDTTPKQYLSKGDSGEAVKTMQEMLTICGYSCGTYGADGSFGNATEKALRAFQSDHKLDVDGKYGKDTKAVLESAYKAKTWKIVKGDSGYAVKKMQEILISLGYQCGQAGADGDFGLNTLLALNKFKSAAGLDADGICDVKTKAALDTAYRKSHGGFIEAVKKVADTARVSGWTYGNSTSQIPCADGKISCDRLIARALYDMGYTDQPKGGITCGHMLQYLPKFGFKKFTSVKEIKPGAVIAVRNLNTNHVCHVFVVTEYDHATNKCTKYDTGSDERIRTVQPFRNVPLVEWGDRVFMCGWNLP